LLMGALEAQGNIPEALRVFDNLRTLLRNELGTMPAPETVAFHERLLSPGVRTRAAPHEEAGPDWRIELPAELMMQSDAPLEARRHYVQNVPYPVLRSATREYSAELSRLIPELRRRIPELAPADTGEPETERYRLFEAVVGLLSEISRTAPVLLVLDDLQWA